MVAPLPLAPFAALIVLLPQDGTSGTHALLSALRTTRVALDGADLAELGAAGALMQLGAREPAHAGRVRSLALDHGGGQALSVGSIGDAVLTGTADGATRARRDLASDEDGTACLAARLLGDDGALCLWSDGTVRVVDLRALEETQRFELGARGGDALVSADGHMLVVLPPSDASGDAAAIRAYDVATGRELGSLAPAGGRVLAAALARDGQHIAFVTLAGRQRTVAVHAVSEAGFGPPLHATALAELCAEQDDFEPGAATVALGHDGSLLALGARGKVHLFDLTRGRAVRALDADDGTWTTHTRALAFDGASARLLVGTEDGALAAFDVAGRRRLWHAFVHAADVTALDLAADGGICASGASDGSLAVRDFRTGVPLGRGGAAGPDVGTADVVTFGQGPMAPVYAAGRAGACFAFDPAGGAPVPVPLERTEDVLGLAPAADALHVATVAGLVVVGADGAVRFEPAAVATRAWTAARDGSAVVLAKADGTVRVARAGTGGEVELRGDIPLRGPLRALGCAPDGATVLAFDADGTRRAWHVDGARLLHETAAGGGAPERSLAWIDAARIAVGLGDGTARIERVDGLTLLPLTVDGDGRLGPRATEGRPDGAPALAASPDGRYVAALTAAHGLVLWAVDTGAVALQLRYAARSAAALAFSDDGARLAAGHRDGSLTLIDLGGLTAWLDADAEARAEAGSAAGADAAPGAETDAPPDALAGATPPALGGEGAEPSSAPPAPDPDATRVRRRSPVPFDARLERAAAAAQRGDDDAAEEELVRALADLVFDPDSASRAQRAATVYQRLAALPGADPAPLGAVAEVFVELARAYQRKGWVEVAASCLDVADLFGPGKGDRVRVALGRAKPGAAAGGRPKKAPAPSAAKPAAKAPTGGKPATGALVLAEPSAGWKIEGQKVLALPGPDDPAVVLIDSAPSEDVRIEVTVEAVGTRRNEFGIVFGASEGLGSAYALVLLHAENTNVVQASLCELRGPKIGDRIAQRKLTLDAVPKEWRLAVQVAGTQVTLELAGAAKFTIPVDRPAHGQHGFLRLAGGTNPTVFQRTRIDPPPGQSAATEAKLGPPKIAPDASVEERIVAAEAHVTFGAIEGAVAHLWRAEALLPHLVDDPLVPALAERIDALLQQHDPLAVRRARARDDAATALLAHARARFEAQRPGASLALLTLARQLDLARAAEALESLRPGLDLALEESRGIPIEPPQPVDNATLQRWLGEMDGRQELWVGGWSTVGASVASPLLVDASSLLRSREPLPAAVQEVSVEVRLEQRGAAGLALGCGEDGSFLAITFDPEEAQSSITVARWAGTSGEGWDQRASLRQKYSPEAQLGWTTVHVRIDGTRVVARVGRGEPVTAKVPTRWTEGPVGLLAIGQHGPMRVRFRNLVVH